MPYVVETPVFDATGARCATMRVWVATEARARELAAQPGSERTWREVTFDAMPDKARDAMERTAYGNR